MTHLEVLCDLTHQPLEGELPDQELCGFLVTTDLAKSNGTGTETMRFLDTAGCSSLAFRTLSASLQMWSKGIAQIHTGAVLRAALEASCLRGALPPVDLRAVCLVRAIAIRGYGRSGSAGEDGERRAGLTRVDGIAVCEQEYL